MKYLNLGCGNRFINSKEWINVDFKSHDPNVYSLNLIGRIPYQDNTIDFIYNSHVLEHFGKKEGEIFLFECYRILKQDGIIRIVVPDLEMLIDQYVNTRNDLIKSLSFENTILHEWSQIELMDQMTRDKSGGIMKDIWNQHDPLLEKTLINRCGFEYLSYSNIQLKKNQFVKKTSLKYRIREFIIKTILKKEYKSLQLGRYCSSGENHKWMYDKYTLSLLLGI